VQAEQAARAAQAAADSAKRELAGSRQEAALQAEVAQQQGALREERLQAELQVTHRLPALPMT
jgi:hypothetical protein